MIFFFFVCLFVTNVNRSSSATTSREHFSNIQKTERRLSAGFCFCFLSILTVVYCMSVMLEIFTKTERSGNLPVQKYFEV